MISVSRLYEVLSYDPVTGLFTWAQTRKKCTLGALAGSTRADGYVLIRIDYKRYYAHHLAWFYMTGEWPDMIIDHEDCDPSNNKWSNIRKATPTQSSQNRRAQINNRLGIKGVWQTDYGYYASIHANGVSKHLGTFSTKEGAADAYRVAAEKYHGEFARVA